MQLLTIGKNQAGQRLDKYLKKALPGAGTGFLYKMLRKKNITLNGKKAEGKEILKELGIEGDYEGIGHLALGYADGEPSSHPINLPALGETP